MKVKIIWNNSEIKRRLFGIKLNIQWHKHYSKWSANWTDLDTLKKNYDDLLASIGLQRINELYTNDVFYVFDKILFMLAILIHEFEYKVVKQDSKNLPLEKYRVIK